MRVFGHQKLILSLLLIAFLAMSLVGVQSMGMTPDGKMQNCPYMGITAVCNMNPLEHLTAWQSLFSAIAPQLTMLALLLLVSLFLLWRYFEDFFVREPDISIPSQYHPHETRIFDPLRLAFARGLIHPKIF